MITCQDQKVIIHLEIHQQEKEFFVHKLYPKLLNKVIRISIIAYKRMIINKVKIQHNLKTAN